MSGTADTHCKGLPATVVDPAACKGSSGAGGAAGAAGAGAGAPSSMPGANGDCPNADPAYGDIGYGVEADDDDCKYHVKWSIPPFARGQQVSFTMVATKLTDGSPVTAATLRAELFVPCELTHVPPAIDFNASSIETSPGTYTIGPVAFDAPGHWAVRFHLSEACNDGPTSPHGHVAFYVNVP